MRAPAASILMLAAVLAGCKGSPVVEPAPQPERPSQRAQARNPDFGEDRGFEPRRSEAQGQRRESRGSRAGRARPADGAQPGQFDFYLLNLSWSPEFCGTHANSPECGQHLGFVLHGLWPQNTDATYPEHCGDAPGPTGLGPLAGIVPTVSLLEHEWTTHGTCTGLSTDQWEQAQRTAYTEVKVPAGFGGSDGMLAPDDILAQFASANPGFPSGSIALSCGNNRLTAIEVCMTKDLRPEACSGVRSCRANAVKITAR